MRLASANCPKLGWPRNPAEPAVTLHTSVFRVLPEEQPLQVDRQARVVVPRGATLRIVLHVRLTGPIEHARLTIPRPAGFELVRPIRPAQGTAGIESRDEAWHFFIDRWDRGERKVDFLVRAELEGTVSTPPPELVPMYDDPLPTAVFGPQLWEIRPSGRASSRRKPAQPADACSAAN